MLPRLAGFLIVLAVTGAVLASAAGAENPAPIRVVTFNLFHGGPWSGLTGQHAELDARLAMVVDELRALRPDVVGLQEVSAGHGRGNIAERLARALGLHWVHAPATSRVFGVGWLGRTLAWAMNFDEGPAVLSRFPVIAHRVHDLPRCARIFDARVLLHVEVATPRGPLDVFSTHVSRDDCQVRRVAELVQARRDGRPAIVTGDFNASERSAPLAALADAGFVDAFRAANPEESGPTVWQRIDAPAPTVVRRVDFVFLRPGAGGRARVLDSRVVLNTPRRRADGTTLWPSDHYGVLAVIDVGLVSP